MSGRRREQPPSTRRSETTLRPLLVAEALVHGSREHRELPLRAWRTRGCSGKWWLKHRMVALEVRAPRVSQCSVGHMLLKFTTSTASNGFRTLGALSARPYAAHLSVRRPAGPRRTRKRL